LNQQFADEARLFIAARNKVLSFDLSDKERELLRHYAELVRVNSPRQNRVAELFLEENREEAMKLLFEQALPAQNEIHEYIGLVIDENNKSSVSFIENMDQKLQEHIYLYLLLGSLLLVGSIVVIFIMLSRVSRQEEQQLKQAQDELAEQKFALDQHVIVSSTDIDGNITYVNDRLCKMTGYSREELIGQNHRILNSGEKDKNYWKEMYDTIASGKVWRDVVRNKAKNGDFYWVDSTIMPLMGENDKPRSYITIRTDVTERMLTEEALRRSQKMEAFGQLTGGIAHDFNNILNVILGNVELLKIVVSDEEKVQKRIRNIQQLTKRAADLTRQLLDFSRTQASNVAPVNITLLINKMEEMVAHSLTPQIEIEWRLAEDLWQVEISPGDFEDALLNVIINARDAMSGSGQLTIETKNVYLDNNCCDIKAEVLPGDYVQLIISDNGEGMSADQQQKIFEPFYTTKGQGKGTGLGLAMVFGFMQRSKGHVYVDSKIDSGTTFNLYLPRTKASASLVDAPTEPLNKILPQGKETILLVDDEIDLRELSEEMLVNLGYKVLTAGSGSQAMALLTEEARIDLLISDVIMPGGINGYELAEQATNNNPALKVLLISGYTENIATSESQNKFNYNLLPKPYSQADLAQKVRTELTLH
jgi:PAS domain S-box-containing protein